MITLAQALALPQADYKTVEESGIDLSKAVSADLHCAVISHPASTKITACTKVPLEGCLGIAIENNAKKTFLVAHTDDWAEGIEEAIRLARRNKRDRLDIHLIGALHGDNSNPDEYSKPVWTYQIQKVIDVINAASGTYLQTFDVGQKAHPATFAIAKKEGKTILVRGTGDIASYEDFETRTGRELTSAFHSSQRKSFESSHALQAVDQPAPSMDFIPDLATPLYVSFDGRAPENRDQTIPRPRTSRGRG